MRPDSAAGLRVSPVLQSQLDVSMSPLVQDPRSFNAVTVGGLTQPNPAKKRSVSGSSRAARISLPGFIQSFPTNIRGTKFNFCRC